MENREIDGKEKCLFGLCNTTNVISYIILICLSYKKAKAKDIMFTQKVAVMHRRLMGASSLRCNVINRCIGGSSSAKDSNTVDTYYDSQSGQHVAMHDESKISVYLRGNNVSFDELVAQKMRPLKKNTSKTKYYKERAGLIREARSAMLQTAKDMGMAGSIISLPPQQIHPDDRAKPPTIEWKQQIMSSSYDTLPDYINSIGSNNVFLHLPPHRHDLLFTSEKSNEEELSTITIPSNINLCFEYGCNDDDELSNNIQRTLDDYDDIQTLSLAIFDPVYMTHEDPLFVAAQIANIIDTTSESFGIERTISNILVDPFVYVEDDFDVADELVQLCEELCYLDVPGSTIKSRLAVAVASKDQVDECLQMGITKYIVGYNDEKGTALEMLKNAVEDTGKELTIL